MVKLIVYVTKISDDEFTIRTKVDKKKSIDEREEILAYGLEEGVLKLAQYLEKRILELEKVDNEFEYPEI